MNHIKDNWINTDMLHASDLNEISALVNELSERQSSIINDEEASDASTFSSNKIAETVGEMTAAMINDEEVSEDTAYSSSKVKEEVESASFDVAVVDELPEVGEENVIYMTPSNLVPEPAILGAYFLIDVDEGLLEIHSESDVSTGVSIGTVFKYQSGTKTPSIITNLEKNNVLFYQNETDGRYDILNFGERIIPQNGHYYRIKDIYQLKPKNITGGFNTLMMFAHKSGLSIIVYEEASSQSDYIETDEIPGVFLLEDCNNYRNGAQTMMPLLYVQEEDIYWPYEYGYTIFPYEAKEGDIFKVTVENTGSAGTPFSYAISVNNGALYFGGSTGISGIESAGEWQKNKFYKFTGYHVAQLGDEGSDDMVANVEIPTFEEVTEPVESYTEVNGLPGFCYRIQFETQMKNKWMWVNNNWEFISGPDPEEYLD